MTFRSVKLGVLYVAALSFTVVGCQKKFDPNAFEAGAPEPSAPASASAAPVDTTTADAGDAGDGLAPLETGKGGAHPTAGAVGTGSHANTTAKVDPPECQEARKACNSRILTRAITKQCNDSRFACFNKGGHL